MLLRPHISGGFRRRENSEMWELNANLITEEIRQYSIIWNLKEHMAPAFLLHPRRAVITEGQGF